MGDNEDRKDRSVLAGMTVEASRKLVAGFRVEDVLGTPVLRNSPLAPETEWSCEALLALAAIGARCVGAKERSEERFWCPDCGNGVSVSEDGGCGSCGRDVEIRACRVLVLEGE